MFANPSKTKDKPCFKSLVFFLINILPILHPLNMFIIIMFFNVHMNRLGSRILKPFFKSVALSKIAHLLFATTFNSHLSISIVFRCAFAIAFIFVDCCTSTYTSMDGYTYVLTTFSSPTSICVIYVSTKCCSTTSSSSNFLMNTRSIDVAPGPICSLACQLLLLLHKNSIVHVLILYIL